MEVIDIPALGWVNVTWDDARGAEAASIAFGDGEGSSPFSSDRSRRRDWPTRDGLRSAIRSDPRTRVGSRRRVPSCRRGWPGRVPS